MPKVASLSKTEVDNSLPQKARYIVWDSSLPGFGLIVQPSGVKSYCYQYRNVHNRSKRYLIGQHGSVWKGGKSLTTKQARDCAIELAAMVLSGKDPQEEKQSLKEALTVSQVLDLYTDSAKFARKAETTKKTDKGRIERHIKPLLGNRIANSLTVEQIRKALSDIERGKTAKTIKTGPRGLARVTGGPGAARMAIRLLKSALKWAHQEAEIIEVNNSVKVEVGQDGSKEIVLNFNDYTRLFEALREMEERLEIRSPVANAIRIIAFSGSRRNEIAGVRWKHVDLKKGQIVYPPKEHKTGGKTNKPRIIRLNSEAQEIIGKQPYTFAEDYVFPPVSGAGPINLSKPWRKIRERAKINPEAGLHALRHSRATKMAEDGYQAADIMEVMGHRNLSTSQKYIHMSEQATSEVAESSSSWISAASKGKS